MTYRKNSGIVEFDFVYETLSFSGQTLGFDFDCAVVNIDSSLKKSRFN